MQANGLFKEWIARAQNDIEAAKILADHYKPKIEIICYLCQQTVEKMLKAFLVFNHVEPGRIHDLEVLCAECEKNDNTFAVLREKCGVLTKYNTQTRYPNNKMDFFEHHMHQAIKYADEIYNFVLEKINNNK